MANNLKRFYDTSTLLAVSDPKEPFIISYITIQELENIKVSSNKDAEIKAKARKTVRFLKENSDKYKVCLEGRDYCIKSDFDLTNDNIILAGAIHENSLSPTIFFTDDILLGLLAKTKGLIVKSSEDIEKDKNESSGYKEVTLTEKEMAYFYANMSDNQYGCKPNEYLLIKNLEGFTVEVRKWDGRSFIELYKKVPKSISFGDKIRPKDDFQKMAIDSIMSNTITAITGKAGSGKSLLSLVCAMSLIDSGKYDRLVVLFNPTTTKGASQLGFYPGTMNEKAKSTSIGNILSSKFGDMYAVDMLIQQGKLKLISMADARGFEVGGNEILYITEAQNTNSELLKLCLTRVSEDAKVIIEGDYDSQVDHSSFEGINNGLKKAIDVFSGENLFGYVKLNNIYRSRIANIADKM